MMEISGPFLQFKNQNLQIALELRKQGRLKEARAYLDKACDDDDGESLFFKGEMMSKGGWGCGGDGSYTSWKYYDRSAKAGCILGMLRTSQRMQPSNGNCVIDAYNTNYFRAEHLEAFRQAFDAGKWVVVYFMTNIRYNLFEAYINDLEFISSFGEAYASNILRGYYANTFQKEKSFQYAIKAAKHCMYLSLITVYSYYECCRAYDKSAYWRSKHGDAGGIINRLTSTWYDESMRLRELYIFGRKFAKGWFPSCGHKQESLQVYRESWAAAQKATVTFLLCCKKWGVYRDVSRLIGQMVWKSRDDPAIWNVKLNIVEPKNKKIKK
jgi:tetratricopeptide (TPR) repeat protein